MGVKQEIVNLAKRMINGYVIIPYECFRSPGTNSYLEYDSKGYLNLVKRINDKNELVYEGKVLSFL